MLDKDQSVIILDGILRSMILASFLGDDTLKNLQERINNVLLQGVEPEEQELLKAWLKYIDECMKA